MLMRRVSAKDRVPNGLVRAALVAGVASGVVAASLGGIGTASGTCIGISGIDIGDGLHDHLRQLCTRAGRWHRSHRH